MDNIIESIINIDQDESKVNFTTLRPLVASSSENHAKLSLEADIPLIFASGQTAATDWAQRTEYGKISLRYNNIVQ